MLCALLLTVACGDDRSADAGARVDGAAPDPLPAGFCARYVAQCPGDVDENTCVSTCEGASMFDEDCGFWACGVEVGLCDNEVDGDPEILACMERHGWLD